MPGFRYCQWCSGKGCMCCDAEEKKWRDRVIANAPKWRESDVRDVRDAVIESEILRGYQSMLSVNEHGRIDALTPDEVEAAFKPALDAEYARQFPNGPTPMFTARRDNPGDMELLAKVFGRAKLEAAFGPNGGGMVEIERAAAEARGTQSLRHLASPDPESEETNP
jgi:hypothetical protein